MSLTGMRQSRSHHHWQHPINKEMNAGLADPNFKARIAGFGGMALVGTPADFDKLMAEETKKWGKVVKFAGMKPD